MSMILDTQSSTTMRAPLRIDRLTAHRLDRPVSLEALIPRNGTGAFVLFHAIRGTMALERGEWVQRLVAGELIALDTAALCRARVRIDGEGIALVVPRECMGGRDFRLDRAMNVVVTTTSGTPSLVAQILKGVSRQILRGDGSGFDAVAAHILGLVELALRHAAPGDHDGSSPSRHVTRAKSYIDEHLADIDLSPERIARAANVSIRTLHRSFEAEGITIGQWIRTQRLERCRRDLIDPELADVPVGAIGARWGIWDAAHFSRAFKQWLGASPSAYRADRAAQARAVRARVPA